MPVSDHFTLLPVTLTFSSQYLLLYDSLVLIFTCIPSCTNVRLSTPRTAVSCLLWFADALAGTAADLFASSVVDTTLFVPVGH